MIADALSGAARRCALRLRLERIQEKIATGEAEITAAENEQRPEPGLFPHEHRGLRSLRERLVQLRELPTGTEAALRARRQRLETLSQLKSIIL